MKNSQKIIYVLGGVFLVSMIGALVGLSYAYSFNPEERLSAHWKLDSNQAWPVLDFSGNDYEGYAHNVLTSLSGKQKYAFLFSGNSYITMGDLPVFNVGPEESLTVSAWVKLNQDIKDYRVIAGKAAASSDNGYMIRHKKNGNIGFRLEEVNGNDEAEAIAEEDYRDNEWHQIVAVLNRETETASLYVDGYLKDTAKSNRVDDLSNDNHFNVGALDNGAVGFEGIIDEVRIYDYAFAGNDAARLYNHECNCEGINISETYPYSPGSLLRAENNYKVYYINGKYQKKWIINPTVFELYNNKWEDVKVVEPEDLDAYRRVKLMRARDDYKVYLIDGDEKTWIESIEEFNKRGFSWDEVDVVKPGELSEYK